MPKKAASRRHTSAERGRRHKASDGELVQRSVPMERTTRRKQKKSKPASQKEKRKDRQGLGKESKKKQKSKELKE
jgi:hypothetical protein